MEIIVNGKNIIVVSAEAFYNKFSQAFFHITTKLRKYKNVKIVGHKGNKIIILTNEKTKEIVFDTIIKAEFISHEPMEILFKP